MGTQVVSMNNGRSKFPSMEITFDEAVALTLDGLHFSFSLHYYQLVYQIFKYSIYIKRMSSKTLWEKAENNLSDITD